VTIYGDYAKVYDSSGQLDFSLQMIPYIEQLFGRHPAEGKTMLELACGTGTVAVAFAQKGWRVYGVDGSAQMLDQARAKAEVAAEEGLDLSWSQQDMRSFGIPERVHLTTCLYDSLNYMLTSEDLLAVFRRVFDALHPGGLFLFDMNTAWVMATSWDGETYFTDSDDLAVIFKGEYDARRQRTSVVVTCFQRVNDLYQKIVEHHMEQAYPREQIATLLTDAGFQVEASYRCLTFQEPDSATPRIMWVARRPGGSE